MAIETLSGVPCKFRAGDTVRFSITNSDYPTDTYSASFCYSRNGTAGSPVAGTEEDGAYVFTLSAATTAALTAGTWKWMVRYTQTTSSEVVTGESGTGDARPHLAANQTASTAQTLLTALEAAITALLGTSDPFTSVSINGQSYTKANLGDYLRQRDKLKAEVIRERQAAALAAGESDGSLYQVRFQPAAPGCFGCK
jgi:FlaG/FlaF family flagellin (archaellin)